MPIELDKFSSLTSLMFAAALDQHKWQDCINYLSDITGVRAHMFGHDLQAGVAMSTLTSSYDPEFVKTYHQHYASVNSWVPGFFEQKVGQTISSEAMCARSELERTEFYNDWVLPQEDILAGGGTILFKEKSRMFIIGGNIRRKDEHLEKDWLNLVKRITPHLQNAISINRAISAQRIEALALGSAVDGAQAAVILVDKDRHILFANLSGRQMLEAGKTVRSDYRQRLFFVAQSADLNLKKTLNSVQMMDHNVSSKFSVAQQNGQISHSCRAARFAPLEQDLFPFDTFLNADVPCVLLTISELPPSDNTQADLVRRFGLTAVEAEVVLKISLGLSTREISDNRNVSLHTVRNQLKSAMSKMNIRRQLDIARLIR